VRGRAQTLKSRRCIMPRRHAAGDGNYEVKRPLLSSAAPRRMPCPARNATSLAKVTIAIAKAKVLARRLAFPRQVFSRRKKHQFPLPRLPSPPQATRNASARMHREFYTAAGSVAFRLTANTKPYLHLLPAIPPRRAPLIRFTFVHRATPWNFFLRPPSERALFASPRE